MMLISLDKARKHLRMDHDIDDSLIEFYINAASAAVNNYLKTGAEYFLNLDSNDVIELNPTNLEPISVPFEVQAAVVLMVQFFYEQNYSGFERGYLPTPVTALLYPLRDPTLQ